MQSLKVGHYTDQENKTGLTVFLFDHPARAAYYLSGSSPASRELSALESESYVNEIHGLMLTGGSAYALGATNGVMKFLREKNRGVKLREHVIPIVPTAAIFDLNTGTSHFPTEENAYQACVEAKENEFSQGRIGAGTGATVGKLIPHASSMQGGLGYAEVTLPGGVKVAVYVVVNTLGDIRNSKGQIIAGACSQNGEFVDSEKYLLTEGHKDHPLVQQENTLLTAVFTNAQFSRPQLKRIAKMAVAGISRAVYPAFTPFDGDIIFCISLGNLPISELTVGTAAVEVIRQAIVNSVKDSKKL